MAAMLSSPPRWRSFLSLLLFLLICLSIYISCTYSFSTDDDSLSPSAITAHPIPWIHPEFYHPSPGRPHWRPQGPQEALINSPESDDQEENFPYSAQLKSPTKLPPIPSWNAPPTLHVREDTPLLIPYTGNWLLLQQTVISFITSGWPASDIHVINNAPHTDGIAPGLDIYRLLAVYRIQVLATPGPLSAGQLRSWMLQTAVEKGWAWYFVAPDSVVALSDEGFVSPQNRNYTTLYRHSVAHVRKVAAANEKWARAILAADGGLTAYNARALAGLPSDEVVRFASCTDLELRFEREKGAFGLHSTQFASHEERPRTTSRLSSGTSENGLIIFRVEEALEDLIVLYRKTSIDAVFKPATLREAIVDSKTNARSPWGGEDEVGGKGWHELVRRVGRLRQAKEAGTC